MGTNPLRFRVEHNKGKTSFWYTLVAGNGNTTMTSKSTYDDYDNALRAARRQVEALQESAIVLEFEHRGELMEEEVTRSTPVSAASPMEEVPGFRRTKREAVKMPEPSFAVAESLLNPQT